jgi:hypothetical protein
MEALWEAKGSIKALQEPEESMASPIDGHCGSRQGLRGRYPRLIDKDVCPGLVQDEKGLLQRLQGPYSDLTVVYMVAEASGGQYRSL